MKKKVTLFLMLLILVSVCICPLTIFAEEGEETTEPLTGRFSMVVNDEITTNVFSVELKIDENPGFISLRAEISYDENVLELINVEDSGLLKIWSPRDDKSSPYVFGWIDALTTENNVSTGKIAVFRFRVKNGAEPQNTDISIKSLECNSADGIKFIDVNFEPVGKTVKITEEALRWNFSIYGLDTTASIICCIVALVVVVGIVIAAILIVKKRRSGNTEKDTEKK